MFEAMLWMAERRSVPLLVFDVTEITTSVLPLAKTSDPLWSVVSEYAASPRPDTVWKFELPFLACAAKAAWRTCALTTPGTGSTTITAPFPAPLELVRSA